ncbi:MAG: hypothetical protein ACXWFB_12460, partial [Nitrososphaeraceae archaeon]
IKPFVETENCVYLTPLYQKSKPMSVKTERLSSCVKLVVFLQLSKAFPVKLIDVYVIPVILEVVYEARD